MEIDELLKIIDSDDIGLLNVKAPNSLKPTADERLIASFKEINDFYREHGRKPIGNSTDMREFQLSSRLSGLRTSNEKIQALAELDEFDLLSEKEITSIDDIFDDDDFGLLKNTEDSIFNLRHVPATIDMPERIARRKPCKNFANYENLFKLCKEELVAGIRESRKFTGEQQIKVGHFFVLHGVMVYVDQVGEKEVKNGKVNARLRLIFDNGTESNMLLRSLATELYKDEAGRRILDAHDKALEELELIRPEDTESGFIYILSSLSQNEEIKKTQNLYKIGFSKLPVSERVKNASKEPTYLMAPVKVEDIYKCYNLNPQKFELLLHTFFGNSRLQLDVHDSFGARHSPREWFIAPIKVIDIAVQLLINGEIIHYRYNSDLMEIEERN
ncbi:GIY-YIG nuclease family protein [Methylotenera sp.]|uniref:GIY-YIG nuclease family protein n=1 Tax=Methylotenera sp. TaxID=2051956 RepID=UPI002736C5C1|nr:GIY-YIG nuclease family protein [Methylotenera sp.]MDP3211906.1 GIY-YIG nuclease family protein [Methylotenera sp.]